MQAGINFPKVYGMLLGKHQECHGKPHPPLIGSQLNMADLNHYQNPTLILAPTIITVKTYTSQHGVRWACRSDAQLGTLRP